MNIIIRPYGSGVCHCRPDTTWERESRDFYSPDSICRIWWTPVIFARISKTGKCVRPKFSERYYDGVGTGILLHCQNEQESLHFSSCVDHSSILPFPLYEPTIFDKEDTPFIIKVNDTCHTIMQKHAGNWKAALEESLCMISELTSLRTGDIIAVELESMKLLSSRNAGATKVSGSYDGNELFSFNVIF